jgi:Na+/H+ antiporter NhaD/arsenite permease-like protein
MHPFNLGEILPLYSVLPFVGILLSIALLPLIKPLFWHRHYGKVTLAWALIFALPFLIFFTSSAIHSILHIYLIDYLPFIILLWGLFTISGGIYLRGTMLGTPAVNTLFLIAGTLLASLIGTTGASMLLIRPVIRANHVRKNKVHVIVFFIFLVSNIGGSLTPLGDPPLFLGFLHGVPFFWTLKLGPAMGLASGLLLAIFFALDSYFYRKEGSPQSRSGATEPLKLEGAYNFILLGGVIGAVLLSGLWKAGEFTVFGVEMGWQDLIRDGFILLFGFISLKITPDRMRDDNGFSWGPIKEVAILFAGIFMTIIPALAILKAGEHGHLAFLVTAVKEPWQYFWASGGLSSFLDNAPTYLTFFNLELGRLGLDETTATAILNGALQQEAGSQFVRILLAVSAGSVFMGANTYIGNAPNFMVRSIAEENKIQMPSFFGYMAWSAGILIPVFILLTIIFF